MEYRTFLNPFLIFLMVGFIDQSGSADPTFITPIGGTPFVDWTIVNYVDLDEGPGLRDYNGGQYTYNGHKGIDFSLPNFQKMDAGVPVFAAAEGTVIEVHEGEFDRNKVGKGQPSNFVSIDHGDGWMTVYHHLRKDPAPVKKGDFVVAGQQIGWVGSSGNSDGAHLHFEVRHNGMPVEPFSGPFNPRPSLWKDQLPYAGEKFGVFDADLTDHFATYDEFKERVPTKTTFGPGDQLVVFWVQLHGTKATDTLTFDFIQPTGKILRRNEFQPGAVTFAWYHFGYITELFLQHLGTWQTVFSRNGTEILKRSFQIVDSFPAI